MKERDTEEKSYFDGDKLSNVFFGLFSLFLRIITLDLAAPVVRCMRLRWQSEHTYLSGRRLAFDGKASALFFRYMKWLLLSVVTLGVFIPFKIVKVLKWETAQTHFAGVPLQNRKSEFTGKWYALFGVNLTVFFVSLLTLGIGSFWASNFKEKFLTAHREIDGHKLIFESTGTMYFKKRLCWAGLSLVTLGIYALCMRGRRMRWRISKTRVTDAQSILLDEELLEHQKVAPVNRNAYLAFILLFPSALFLVCGWASRVLLRHGLVNPVAFVPFVFCLAACAIFFVSFWLSIAGYRFSRRVQNAGQRLSIAFIGLSVGLAIVSLVELGVFLWMEF